MRWLRGRLLALGTMAALAGCRATPPRHGGDTGTGTAAAGNATVVFPAESLVFRAATGAEVWFTDAREARSAGGEACLERALEIRRGTVRLRIPLLYTREAPTRLDDTTMRAVLYNGCMPQAAYRVDYATASPRRMAE